jgi:hydroxyacylglutathione hydrolase
MASETTIQPLSPQTVSELQAQGAWVFDVREFEDYGAAHVPNALTIQLTHPKLIERIQRLIPQGASLVLVLPDASALETAAARINEAGQYTVAGYLDGGMAAWQANALPVATLEQMSIHELVRRMDARDDSILVVDCRERIEYEGLDRVERTVLLPMFETEARCRELDTSRKIVVICERGHRSTTVASILERKGVRNVAHVPEGLVGWRAAHYPTIS